MKTPLSSILFVLGASFVGSFGAVFLKMGGERAHREIWSVVTNWRLALGVFLFVASSMLYLRGLKYGQLSILYPMVSLGYVWTMFWSRLFFNEPVTRGKLAGVGVILAGIIMLALGNQ